MKPPSSLASDVCVIGGGAAGLSVAAGSAQLGLRTILIERGDMGGECLHRGCVPSKALLAAGKRARAVALPGFPGVAGCAPDIDFHGVKDGVQDIIDALAPHDSAQRFERLGVQVIAGTARFLSPDTVRAGDVTVRARWFVIATGSRAVIPDIPGLEKEHVLTNESIFSLRRRPEHLIILGGGRSGVEIALSHRRLGIPVTVLEKDSILRGDEPELVDIVRQMLRAEGIAIHESAEILRVERMQEATAVFFRHERAARSVVGSDLLVAAGTAPEIEDLQLDVAKVDHDPRGIKVDRRLRTSQRRIFAIGNVIDGPHLTHVAGYHAGIVLRNIAFRIPARVSYRALPWVTYTDPELAHVGLTEEQARRSHGANVVARVLPLSRSDRAVIEGATGALKVVTDRNGRILGASVLAPSAGEAIGLWCLAIERRLTLRAVAELMLPYPTIGEVARAAARDHFAPKVFGATSRLIVKALRWLPGI